MEKFSVKKPFTILVSVIIIIVLGVVSFTSMTTDLLPELSLPYMIVITPYPGASPEKVELEVSQPMENALGTVSHVKNVLSVSYENFAMTQLEFEDGTDMDSAMVKVSGQVQQIAPTLPSGCGTPSIMEISMNMVATMYLAVSREGYDIYELSDFVDKKVRPYLARQEGVASVTTIGLVEKSIQVDLDADKIRDLNDRILAKTNKALNDAKKQLDDAKSLVDRGQEALQEQEKNFGEMLSSGLFGALDGPADELRRQLKSGIAGLVDRLDSLSRQAGDIGSDIGSNPITDNISDALKDIEDAYGEGSQDVGVIGEAMSQARDDVNAINEGIREAISGTKAADGSGNAGTGDVPADGSGAGSGDAGNGSTGSAGTDTVSDPADNTGTGSGDNTGTGSDDNTGSDPGSSDPGNTSSDGSGTSDPSSSGDGQQPEPSTRTSRIQQAAERTREAMASAIRLRRYIASGDIRNRITNIIRTLREASAVLDGGTFSSLASAISKIVTAGSEIRVLMDELSEADVEGMLSGPLGNVRTALGTVSGYTDRLPELLSGIESGFAMLTQGQLDAALGFSTAAWQLTEAQTQLETASAQYESARSQALKSANVDSLVSVTTLSGLIYAQNFSMPAGYIDDENDNSWLLKVGDEFDSSTDISDALLADIDGIGTIRLSDVANVTVIDNADDSFAKLNGENGVVLSIFKSSTAGTNEVSRNCWDAIAELEADNEGLHVANMMDQGEYITIIVTDILMSMGLGALLAMIVLAIFLRDVRPTLMVAISIPLSVLFTILLMYFTGLSMNIMTLSGLSLGIGMLVDNSIVVMENIIRLRQRGLSAPRASVQGAKQVSGAIISSTLTTVCVFLPMVFTEGTVRELLVPMALSITYCLTASLIVAMTVIPASASTIMRKVRKKKSGVFDRVLDFYGNALGWCLSHKLAAILIAVVLLGVSVFRLVTMGIVLIPDIATENIQVTIRTPKEDTREESYRDADEAMRAIMAVDGVENVGIMDMASSVSFVSSVGGMGSGSNGNYLCFVAPSGKPTVKRVEALSKDIEEAVKDLRANVTVSSGGMSDMTALMPQGMQINIYGEELEKLTEIGKDVIAAIETVEGFEDASDGSERDDKALHLVIDKDKAMSYGLTVAQIYTEISSRMLTSTTSTTITQDGVMLDVTIRDETDPLTRENILDIEFNTSGAAGMSSGSMAQMAAMMGGSSGMSSGSMGGLAAMFGGASGSAGGLASMMGGSSGSFSDMLSSMGGSSGASDGMGGLAELFGGMTGSGSGDAGNSENDTDSPGSGDGSSGTSADNSSDTTDNNSVHKLGEFATLVETSSPSIINRENQSRYITVSARTAEGYNTTLLARQLQGKLDAINRSLPNGYSVEIGGETIEVNRMVNQMSKALALAFVLIYMVMVAQFQSLLSPFIILFTIPLAFTGGMLGLIIAREQLSLLSLMGFLILMGTVVNNGIVFVDYVNQLRIGGMPRREALVATGKTRMRPILMTAMTTILAMVQLIFGTGMSVQLSRGMAIVIASGLMYATLMTLLIVPVMYDIFFKKPPLNVDLGSDMDDVPDDAAEFMEELREKSLAEEISKRNSEAEAAE